MTKTSTARTEFLEKVRAEFGDITQITRAQIKSVCEKYDLSFPTWIRKDPERQVSRGVYSLPENGSVVSSAPPSKKKATKVVAPKVEDAPAVAALTPTQVPSVTAMVSSQVVTRPDASFVPEKASGYVPFGNFADVRSIIKSKKFYPAYITGLSGNGKTLMVEQVCAAEKRECIRVNITIETDEDDLIGGFRLIDGQTVWQDGPVITAMQRGAVLLLDEVDLGSNKLMCLQPVLEGKAIFLKKVGKVVHPENGFNVIATANTKGKGSDDGRFIGTNVMNEAFLERFSITFEQEYPPLKTEAKILNNVLGASGIEDQDFANKLVNWADMIRKAFYDGAVSDIISTRRLVHICEAYAIFGRDREKAIKLCLNRFDVDTKGGFWDLYAKLDETVAPKPTETVTAVNLDEEVPF